MLDNALTSFNWLDLVMAVVVAVTVYRGAVHGFVVEFFKVIGIFLATVISMHFFTYAANFLKEFLMMPLLWGQLVSYIIFSVLIILFFRVVGQGWLLILKVDGKAGFNQWGGTILAFFSSFLLCGLLFFGILMAGNQTLNKFARNSVSGYYLIDLAPNVYKAVYQGIIVPFFPDEGLNKKIFEIL